MTRLHNRLCLDEGFDNKSHIYVSTTKNLKSCRPMIYEVTAVLNLVWGSCNLINHGVTTLGVIYFLARHMHEKGSSIETLVDMNATVITDCKSDKRFDLYNIFRSNIVIKSADDIAFAPFLVRSQHLYLCLCVHIAVALCMYSKYQPTRLNV